MKNKNPRSESDSFCIENEQTSIHVTITIL